MNSEEIVNKIIGILKVKNTSYKKIKEILQIDDNKVLNVILTELEQSGILYLNNYDEYQLLSTNNNLVFGMIKVNKKNQVYVATNRKTIIIPNEYLNGAITNDFVIVKRIPESSYAKVEKIVKRDTGNMIFEYDDGQFIPYNFPVKINLYIPRNIRKKIINGSRLLINVSLKQKHHQYNGKIISIIGHKDDPKLDIKTIVSSYGVIINFSKEATIEANQLNCEVTQDEINTRIHNGGLDLRCKTIFTIDGVNTKDMDDAVSIEKLSNGDFLLGVHIADVSHYVKKNSFLDLEARKRSTSIYPFNSAINMLPRNLANGICSLNPNVDRLTLSCIMQIDQTGTIKNYKFVDTIINSKIKMTYEEVNDILDNGQIIPGYSPFINDLKLMMQLSKILDKKKLKRGYINFGDNEILMDDKDGKAISIQKYVRGTAQKIIENFMLCANECAASYYYYLNLPGIYRNHPSPNPDTVKEIIELLNLKIPVPKDLKNPHTIQNIINIIQKYDKENIYSNLLLKSMKRAYYSPNNIGHYGLALETYTHFTSPIRRYPDLETHRIIRKIQNDILNIDEIKTYEYLKEICINASKQERLAEKIEKRVTGYKVCEYMEGHIGEYYLANISYIGKKGVKVKTKNGIKGKLNFELLKNMGYIFDNEHKRLINTETNEILFIGDDIRIISKSADKDLGKIEFQFIEKIDNKEKEYSKKLRTI